MGSAEAGASGRFAHPARRHSRSTEGVTDGARPVRAGTRVWDALSLAPAAAINSAVLPLARMLSAERYPPSGRQATCAAPLR